MDIVNPAPWPYRRIIPRVLLGFALLHGASWGVVEWRTSQALKVIRRHDAEAVKVMEDLGKARPRRPYLGPAREEDAWTYYEAAIAGYTNEDRELFPLSGTWREFRKAPNARMDQLVPRLLPYLELVEKAQSCAKISRNPLAEDEIAFAESVTRRRLRYQLAGAMDYLFTTGRDSEGLRFGMAVLGMARDLERKKYFSDVIKVLKPVLESGRLSPRDLQMASNRIEAMSPWIVSLKEEMDRQSAARTLHLTRLVLERRPWQQLSTQKGCTITLMYPGPAHAFRIEIRVAELLEEYATARSRRGLPELRSSQALWVRWSGKLAEAHPPSPYELVDLDELEEIRTQEGDVCGLRVALALARFHAERGAWPGRLADLVPAYLPEEPIDPDGQSLRWELTPEGGKVVLPWRKGGEEIPPDYREENEKARTWRVRPR